MIAEDRLVDEIFRMHGHEDLLPYGEKKFSKTDRGYHVIGQYDSSSKYGCALSEEAMTSMLETNPKLKELFVVYCLE